MSSDHPPRGRGEPATDSVGAAHETWPAAEDEEYGEGGDPACWAGIVCQECGAVISEGHRSGCSQEESAWAGPVTATATNVPPSTLVGERLSRKTAPAV
jgi:hypothetical protein